MEAIERAGCRNAGDSLTVAIEINTGRTRESRGRDAVDCEDVKAVKINGLFGMKRHGPRVRIIDGRPDPHVVAVGLDDRVVFRVRGARGVEGFAELKDKCRVLPAVCVSVYLSQ